MMVSYKELVNHCNKIICNRWTSRVENKFGCIFERLSPNGIDGLDVLEWIKKNQVPNNKMVTYPRYTAFNRPEKVDKPFRVLICAVGNLLQYDGDITTYRASMETIKAHLNSVVSTTNTRYCTADISNMHLVSDLVDSEYVKFNYSLIPQRIIEH